LLKFSNTYIELGEQFFQRILPEKVASAGLLLWNEKLAKQLNFSNDLPLGSCEEKALLAQYFSGNNILDGAEPIALAYSGHQFGHFNPQLGDGRAHLLGEVLDSNGIRRDIQLKGSGRTAFSRRGDGKCALAPALREYMMSEAMFALGVPTSRCLAVVSTGELINRGTAKAGAVVTRVASSHIRVGTFQYFASRGDLVSLTSLLDYTIDRHFPEINNSAVSREDDLQEQRLLAFLEQAIAKQITLVVAWLRVGFIHGVMNTDNTAICGETIDFGPCAMLGIYDENAVFSSIDEYGRYAFTNQAKIAQWNMARLADCLLPLLLECSDGKRDEKSDKSGYSKEQESRAVAKVEAVIHQYTHKFEQAYYAMYANKLGLDAANSDNHDLIDGLLAIMQTKGLDYTQTFHRLTQSLTQSLTGKVKAEALKNELGEWYETWLCALNSTNSAVQHKVNIQDKVNIQVKAAQTLMSKSNPVVIPRNHHVEAILTRCEEAINDDSQQVAANDSINHIVNEFLTVLQSPYQELDSTKNFQDTPEDGDQYYQTFCGT